MIVSREHKFVYTAVTKTATQTMFKVLTRHYGGERVGDMHAAVVPAHARNYFKWAVVRNPYDRAVSLWWSTTQRARDRYGFREACPDPDDFTAFAKWLATNPFPGHALTRTQTQHLDGMHVDMTLRFESLEEDFKSLPFYNGEPEFWPRQNMTADVRKPWWHYMTPEAYEAVHAWAGDDFDRFGYSREAAR